MKNLIAALLIISVLCTCMIPVFATEKNVLPEFIQEIPKGTVTDVEYHKDGSVTVTTLEIVDQTRATKTGKKTKTAYNSNGTIAFSVTNTSTFSYTGSSAVCTAISASKSISDSSWSVATSNMRSDNTGIVRYTGTRNNGSTNTGIVSVTCSPSGVIS